MKTIIYVLFAAVLMSMTAQAQYGGYGTYCYPDRDGKVSKLCTVGSIGATIGGVIAANSAAKAEAKARTEQVHAEERVRTAEVADRMGCEDLVTGSRNPAGSVTGGVQITCQKTGTNSQERIAIAQMDRDAQIRMGEKSAETGRNISVSSDRNGIHATSYASGVSPRQILEQALKEEREEGRQIQRRK